MSAAIAQPQPSAKVPWNRLLLAGVIAIAGSIVANLLIGWLARLLLPISSAFMPLSAMPTIIFTTLFLVIATGVYAVINVFAKNPPRVFSIVALVALVLSLLPNLQMLFSPSALPMPIPAEAITPTAVIVLMLQHVAAYLITVWAFVRWAPQK